MAGSEIKRLLEEITLSYQAAQRALASPAIVAKHEFIQKRMEEIGAAHEHLKELLGDEEAMRLVVGRLEVIEDLSQVRSLVLLLWGLVSGISSYRSETATPRATAILSSVFNVGE